MNITTLEQKIAADYEDNLFKESAELNEKILAFVEKHKKLIYDAKLISENKKYQIAFRFIGSEIVKQSMNNSL